MMEGMAAMFQYVLNLKNKEELMAYIFLRPEK